MKLFHSWKRWQLIALVCVVLTAVLTLVFVLQGGGGDTQPTGGTEGLQLATETLGDVTEPPETAAPTEEPTAAPTEATEAPTEVSTEATKATEAPTAVTQPATEEPTEPPATEPAAPSCTVSISCTTVLDNWDKLSEAIVRVVLKLLLLPIVVGISYEFNRLVGRHDNWLTRALSAPGMWLQYLTTNEPDDSMLEVGIEALTLVLPEKEGEDRW